MEKPAWFKVLEAARGLSGNGDTSFGAAALAEAADIGGAKRSTAEQIASGWLSKFVKWGYALRSGTLESGSGKKWTRAYVLTKSGLEVEFKASPVQRMIEAVNALEDARGTKKEASAYTSLIQLRDRIEKDRKERRSRK